MAHLQRHEGEIQKSFRIIITTRNCKSDNTDWYMLKDAKNLSTSSNHEIYRVYGTSAKWSFSQAKCSDKMNVKINFS